MGVFKTTHLYFLAFQPKLANYLCAHSLTTGRGRFLLPRPEHVKGFLLPHRNYLIRYPNGFKRHASRQEILLLGSSLEQTGPREYQAKTMAMDGARTEPDYYRGLFIFEDPRHKRHTERLESSEALALRLQVQT
jgi:hypothetical protein